MFKIKTYKKFITKYILSMNILEVFIKKKIYNYLSFGY